MKEANFASEIKRACDTFECFYFKIPDASMAQRFIPPKPFDAFIVSEGKFHAIEYKMHKKETAWPFKEVKEHQIEGLWNIKCVDGGAWIFVNLRWKGANKAYAISIENFIGLKVAFENPLPSSGLKPRKSLPIEEFPKYFKEITRTSRDKDNKLCWDIEEFLKINSA